MKDIKTHNIISTPNITGNIGSCETHTASVVSARLSFWKQERTNIATNSCTGDATYYKTWEYAPPSYPIFIGLTGLALLIISITLGAIFLIFEDRN
ncbi:MAG: hypothetical protein KBA02_00220 [Paludibacteraceae bacterium]|nr:hypothetical protein [Paludibacteraceae bacterium]